MGGAPDPRWIKASRRVDDLEPLVIGAGETAAGAALSLVSDSAEIRIGFPPWDSRRAARSFFEWLLTSEDGDGFCDLNPGWRFDARRVGANFHFLDRDMDTGKVLANVATDCTTFLRLLETALRR